MQLHQDDLVRGRQPFQLDSVDDAAEDEAQHRLRDSKQRSTGSREVYEEQVGLLDMQLRQGLQVDLHGHQHANHGWLPGH